MDESAVQISVEWWDELNVALSRLFRVVATSTPRGSFLCPLIIIRPTICITAVIELNEANESRHSTRQFPPHSSRQSNMK